jgi:hypothetical protein
VSIPVAAALDHLLNQSLNMVVEKLAADPGTVTDGRIFYNTTQNVFKVGHNGSWVTFYTSTTRLDQVAAPTAAVALNGQKITGLADGTAPTDAATKQQVDAAVAGMDIKASARVASTVNIAALSGLLTVDGVTVSSGDRVLVKDQTTQTANGVYVAAAGAWARASDMDSWAEIPGSIIAVEAGTANADTVWLATADQGGTLGSTNVTFTKIAPAAAGGSGTVIKNAQDITGNGALTSFAVTHGLGSSDIQCQVWEATSNTEVFVEKVKTSTTVVTINFAVAPANGKVYRVVTMA